MVLVMMRKLTIQVMMSKKIEVKAISLSLYDNKVVAKMEIINTVVQSVVYINFVN